MNPTFQLDRTFPFQPAGWASTHTAPFLPTRAVTPDLRFGEFRVAGHLDLLYRREEVVPLEPRAVQVLRVLAQYRGQVLSKESLIDRVWPQAFVTEGVLKKAISQARRALGENAQGLGWIETFHRRGYRLRGARTSA
jgi:DNA-binding winged helix-turn-helix (wHTH) protein